MKIRPSMRNFLLLVVCLLGFFASTQIVTSFIGNRQAAHSIVSRGSWEISARYNLDSGNKDDFVRYRSGLSAWKILSLTLKIQRTIKNEITANVYKVKIYIG